MNVQLCWISLFSKFTWITTTATVLFHELGVNGEKKLMETRILLIKIDIAHFTLVNLEVLTEIDLKSTEDKSQCQKKN